MYTESLESLHGSTELHVEADQPVYLKPAVKLEPLVCRWPASPHLIAPATRAMNIAYRYLHNLRSFVANPSVHVAAAKDPALLGGPFVDLPASEVPRIRDLIATTLKRTESLLRFADEFRAFDRELQTTADGLPLDHKYSELPPSLSGVVDLVYDLNDHPSIRLMESLLYQEFSRDPFEEICLHKVGDLSRKFVMSTPLLDGPDTIILSTRFDHPVIDDLASMRLTGSPLRLVTEKLSAIGVSEQTLREFFTQSPPERVCPEYEGSGIRVRYFGHACVLVQTSMVSILIDPLTAWERQCEEAKFTFDDLPDFIDYAVISHGHQDHFVPEFLLQLRKRIGTVIVPRNDQGNLADPSIKLMLMRLGYTNITVLDPFDSIPILGGMLTSVPFVGEHASLNISSKHCPLIRVNGRSLLFLVDSNVVDPMLYKRIAASHEPIDAVFIGMECHGAPLSWLYGPLLSQSISRRNDESRRLSSSNCERAWNFLQAVPCSRVYIYAMGSEPWLRGLLGLEYGPDSVQLTEADALVTKCREHGIPAERLRGCCELTL